MGNIFARKIASLMDLDSADSEPKRVTVHNTAGMSLCFWVNGGGPFHASPKRGVPNSASFAVPRHIAITSSLKLQATVVVDGDGSIPPDILSDLRMLTKDKSKLTDGTLSY